MTMTDEDLLMNEARRLCSSLDGRVNTDQLRQNFASAVLRQGSRRRATHAAFNAAVERAKQNCQLRQDEDGSLRLRDI